MSAWPLRGVEADACALHRYQRLCKRLPRHLVLANDQRSARLQCRGHAIPQAFNWPINEWLDRLLHRKEQSSTEQKAVPFTLKQSKDGSVLVRKKQLPIPVKGLVDATANAVLVGLKLTGVALQLAKIIANSLHKSLQSWRGKKSSGHDAASDLLLAAQTQLLQKAHREMLEEQGKDAAFMQMLRNLDRCHINHEEKWALFTRLSADKKEFSQRWQNLYRLAERSKAAVDTLLAPDASRSEINSFWRSAETSAIIAEENALKQIVFNQVFRGGSA